MDIYPTLADLCGLGVPGNMHGKSLLPILEGKCDPHKHRDFVRSIYYRVLQGRPSYASMIRTREHKLVQYHGHGLGELFDMKKDPHEFNNLADQPQYAAIQQRLQAQLDSWRQRTNDPLTDPAKLARLTKEQDEQAGKYKKEKRFRGGPWKYHQYLDSDLPKRVSRRER